MHFSNLPLCTHGSLECSTRINLFVLGQDAPKGLSVTAMEVMVSCSRACCVCTCFMLVLAGSVLCQIAHFLELYKDGRNGAAMDEPVNMFMYVRNQVPCACHIL